MTTEIKGSHIVFIREINSDTVLHLTVRGGSACLRDFSRGPSSKPTEERDASPGEIAAHLARPGNSQQPAPRHDVKDAAFWHDHVSKKNAERGLSGSGVSADSEPAERLLDVFDRKLGKLLDADCSQELLTSFFAAWAWKFEAIEEKAVEFNHWDRDSAADKVGGSSGLAWTASMLEHSRARGEVNYIDSGDATLDFSLLAMDVNLGISSKNNPFQDNKTDYIKPDGIGIRRDGTFCVLEVKAEGDPEDQYRAAIQGLCGAVAVYAKRWMCRDLAARGHGFRPAVPGAKLPSDIPSLGVYVGSSSNHYKRPNEEVMRRLNRIAKAWGPLREFVFFSVDRAASNFPAELRPDLMMARDRDCVAAE